MNKIEIRKIITPESQYETDVFFIDGIPLYEYFERWFSENPDLKKMIKVSDWTDLKPFDYYDICWTDEYDWEGDARFMRYVLAQKKAITPILSCPDDFDFSCILFVADVEKNADRVLWRRIGKVNHSGESFEEEKKYGILYVDGYSEEDWNRYGDNIALAKVDTSEFNEWVAENWSEELYRRRINYTFPYYQDETHIDWIKDCAFEFDRKEYDQVVDMCYNKN